VTQSYTEIGSRKSQGFTLVPAYVPILACKSLYSKYRQLEGDPIESRKRVARDSRCDPDTSQRAQKEFVGPVVPAPAQHAPQEKRTDSDSKHQ